MSAQPNLHNRQLGMVRTLAQAAELALSAGNEEPALRLLTNAAGLLASLVRAKAHGGFLVPTPEGVKLHRTRASRIENDFCVKLSVHHSETAGSVTAVDEHGEIHAEVRFSRISALDERVHLAHALREIERELQGRRTWAGLYAKARHSLLRVDSSEFETAHGHPPRGRGAWAFFFDGATKAEDAWFAPGIERYSDAKRAAQAEGARRGARSISVGS